MRLVWTAGEASEDGSYGGLEAPASDEGSAHQDVVEVDMSLLPGDDDSDELLQMQAAFESQGEALSRMGKLAWHACPQHAAEVAAVCCWDFACSPHDLRPTGSAEWPDLVLGLSIVSQPSATTMRMRRRCQPTCRASLPLACPTTLPPTRYD